MREISGVQTLVWHKSEDNQWAASRTRSGRDSAHRQSTGPIPHLSAASLTVVGVRLVCMVPVSERASLICLV
jgi:hypothetical protein